MAAPVIDLSGFTAPQYGHGLAGRWQAASTVLDELDRLDTCRRAIADLMLPETDLGGVDREALSTLLNYLNEQHEALMQSLRDALRD